jgi:transposase
MPRRGPSRKLTEAQIHRVLTWDVGWREFRKRRETVAALARRLQVKTNVVYYCIARYRALGSTRLFAIAHLTRRGRPRLLREWQARAVIAWYLRSRRFLLRHGSVHVLAHELRVSKKVVYDCIRRRGVYQPSTNRPTAGREPSHPHRAVSVLSRSQVARDTNADNRRRANLLRRWRRIVP